MRLHVKLHVFSVVSGAPWQRAAKMFIFFDGRSMKAKKQRKAKQSKKGFRQRRRP